VNKLQLLAFTTILAASSSLWAADTANNTTTNTPNAIPEKTMPYGENPSLGRVILYKTGKGMQNLGGAIQQGSDKTSEKMSKTWQEAKIYGAEQSQAIQSKAEETKEVAAKKLQDTKDAVIGTNNGNVPIERVELSQPTTN
jgi:hypothetical protein